MIVLCSYCQKPTNTTFNDCSVCGLSKPTGTMMQAEIDSLKSQLASSQERIEKLEGALKRVANSYRGIHEEESILMIAEKALGPSHE